jgi:hypothetical protein
MATTCGPNQSVARANATIVDDMEYMVGDRADSASRRKHIAEELVRVLWQAPANGTADNVHLLTAAIALLRWGNLGIAISRGSFLSKTRHQRPQEPVHNRRSSV